MTPSRKKPKRDNRARKKSGAGVKTQAASAEWSVIYHDDFAKEVDLLPEEIRERLVGAVRYLKAVGPHSIHHSRRADALQGSKYQNMRRLRLNNTWRCAYAFDPERKAVLLVAGSKAGVAQKLFYDGLIATADKRYSEHLEDMKKREK